jgi:hypothetical protein
MPRPYSIKIVIPAGDPERIRTIETSNWSGAGVVIPRALFGEGKLRLGADLYAVYARVSLTSGTGSTQPSTI